MAPAVPGLVLDAESIIQISPEDLWEMVNIFLSVSEVPVKPVKIPPPEITEPVPTYTNDGMTKELYTVFSYDVKTDRLIAFKPKSDSSDPDEIQRLINSSKLKKAKTKLGIENMHDDLKKRMSILQKIIDEDINNLEKISKEIFKYYETK